jgi:Pentapeptide repeats (9 copies)
VGCRGVHVADHDHCLAHLTDSDRARYLASLGPGADLDHRGTLFTPGLLAELLQRFGEPAQLGTVKFTEASFAENVEDDETDEDAHFWADFSDVTFNGDADFNDATFNSLARFCDARFTGASSFHKATFNDHVQFQQATFTKHAAFGSAAFNGETAFDWARFDSSVWFINASFGDRTSFGAVTFNGDALFGARFSTTAFFFYATFNANADFRSATFNAGAWFQEATFNGGGGGDNLDTPDRREFFRVTVNGDVMLSGATFNAQPMLGPLVCKGRVDLSHARFAVPVTIQMAARELHCERTQWNSTATLRLRYAQADLGNAILSAPVAITAHPTPFTTYKSVQVMVPDAEGPFIMPGAPGAGMGRMVYHRQEVPIGEEILAGCDPGVRVTSLRGVDAAHLLLTDIDLSGCVFAGAFHLDQLRLEGNCVLAQTPVGFYRHRIWPTRWSKRRTLAEEHHWRALPGHNPAVARGWQRGPHHPDSSLTSGPEDIAATYRQLRKAFEDGKNEPDAADFYYGEMEMRRHSPTRPASERHLLGLYWLLSGYGLRASRTLGWLLVTMTATVLAIMMFGLPTNDPTPQTTGTITGNQITLNTNNPSPAINGPLRQRLSWTRMDKATRVVINSVVFRSSGQNLTTTGTYIEMTSRLLEPILLALAILAIRGRVKR